MTTVLPNLDMSFSDFLLAALLIICIITDLKSRRVYNKILVPFLAVALVYNFASGGWQMLLDSFKGLFMGLLILIIPFARGGIGAGDVKLLSVIGGIKGTAFVVSAFLAAALAGGFLSLLLLAVNGRLLATLTGFIGTFTGLLTKYGILVKTGIQTDSERPIYFPYTLAIGAGVAAVYATEMQTLLRW